MPDLTLSKLRADYFVPVKLLEAVLGVLVPLFFMVPSAKAPWLIRPLFAMFNPARFWINLILKITLAVHILEGLAALAICLRHRLRPLPTALWVGQTLVYGVFSLRHLLWPKYTVLKMRRN